MLEWYLEVPHGKSDQIMEQLKVNLKKKQREKNQSIAVRDGRTEGHDIRKKCDMNSGPLMR